MTSYRRFIPPLVPIDRAAARSVFPSLMAERLRNQEKSRRKPALDDWENDGGSIEATDAAITRVAIQVGDKAAPSRFRSTKSPPREMVVGEHAYEAMDAMSTPDTDGGDRRYASYRHACPRCNGSMYRVPRRFVDLLLSKFVRVRRYRCDSMGCTWEGNLREKRHSQFIHKPR